MLDLDENILFNKTKFCYEMSVFIWNNFNKYQKNWNLTPSILSELQFLNRYFYHWWQSQLSSIAYRILSIIKRIVCWLLHHFSTEFKLVTDSDMVVIPKKCVEAWFTYNWRIFYSEYLNHCLMPSSFQSFCLVIYFTKYIQSRFLNESHVHHFILIK